MPCNCESVVEDFRRECPVDEFLSDRMLSSEKEAFLERLYRRAGTVGLMEYLGADFYPALRYFVPKKDMWPEVPGRRIERIAVVCWGTRGGGAERATLLWARQVSRSLGMSIVWICDERPEGERKTYDAEPGITFVEVPLGGASRAVRLASVLRERLPDACLFVDHSTTRAYADVLVAKETGCKLIMADHSCYWYPLDDGNFTLYQLRENYYPIIDAVTVLSPDNVGWWRSCGMDNVVYMPNFLTFQQLEDNDGRTVARRRKERWECVFVGRICKRKNAIAVVEAVRRLICRHPESRRKVHLTILGRYEGMSDRCALERYVERYDMGSFVSIVGEVSDVEMYYRQSDLLIVASRIEGAPMVIMEAKSHGIPTVMYDLPYVEGASEEQGVVPVPYGDPSALADGIFRLCTDPQRYERLSMAARTSLWKYESGTIVVRWRKLFDALERGARMDPQCELVPAERLLERAMVCISRIVPVLSETWSDQQSRERGLRCQLEAEQQLRVEMERLEMSCSYKVARMLVWPFRMARNTVKCWRENGFAYTVGRIPMKFVNLYRRFFG